MHATARAFPRAVTRSSRKSTASASAAGSRSPRCATCASAARRAASARRSRTSGSLWRTRRWCRWSAWQASTSRSRSCSKDVSSTPNEAKDKRLVTRVVADDEVEAEARRPRSASPTARRWSRAGTSSSRAGWPTRDQRRRVRRVLRLFRYRGLSHRLRGIPPSASLSSSDDERAGRSPGPEERRRAHRVAADTTGVARGPGSKEAA